MCQGVPCSTLILRGFPPGRRFILHCTLLLKAAGQEKFAPLVPASRAKVQNGPETPVRRLRKNEA